MTKSPPPLVPATFTSIPFALHGTFNQHRTRAGGGHAERRAVVADSPPPGCWAATAWVSFRLPCPSPAFHIQPGTVGSQCTLAGQALGLDVISLVEFLSLSTVIPGAGSPSMVPGLDVAFSSMDIQC